MKTLKTYRYIIPVLAIFLYVVLLYSLRSLDIAHRDIYYLYSSNSSNWTDRGSTFLSVALNNRSFTLLNDFLKPARKEVLHPALSKDCYKYYSLYNISNICKSTLNQHYGNHRIMECATLFWKDHCSIWKDGCDNPPSIPKVPAFTGYSREASLIIYKASLAPTTTWVFVGDSHIRAVFEEFTVSIASPRVMYRIEGFQGQDNYLKADYMVKIAKANRSLTYQQPMHELIHRDIPLKIVFYWDPFLTRLSGLVKMWIDGGDRLTPTHLIIGTALHYMVKSEPTYKKYGAKKASKAYSQHLNNLLPLLRKYSKTTSTIYKLQDPLQEHEEGDARTQESIDLYNNLTIRILSGSDVVLWDSTLPLANIYNRECRQKPLHTIDRLWLCMDHNHIGQIAVKKYSDMLLGHICDNYVYQDLQSDTTILPHASPQSTQWVSMTKAV